MGWGWKGVCASVAAAEQNAKSHQRISKVEDLRNVLVAFQYFGVHCMLHHSFVKCSHAALGVWLSCSIHLHLLPIPLSAFACLEIGDKSATACGYQLQQWNRCQLQEGMCGRQLGNAPPACIAMNTTKHPSLPPTQLLPPVKLQRPNIKSTATPINLSTGGPPQT